MLHITDKTTREELENEILTDDSLYRYLGGKIEIDKLDTEALIEKITEWIIEGDETLTTQYEGMYA